MKKLLLFLSFLLVLAVSLRAIGGTGVNSQRTDTSETGTPAMASTSSSLSQAQAPKKIENSDIAKFSLVTDATTLTAGDKIIVVYNPSSGTKYAMGALSSSGNNRSRVAVTINSDNTIDYTSSSTYSIVTIEASENSSFPYYLTVENSGTKYLTSSTSSNYLQEKDSKSNIAQVKFASVTSGNATTITFNAQKSKKDMTLQYNSASTGLVFSTYSSSQNAVQVYKAESGKAEAELAYSPESITLSAAETLTQPTLSNPHDLTISYSSSNSDVATVDASTGFITIAGATGTAVITAESAETDTYKAGKAQCTITVVGRKDAELAYSPSSVEVTVGRDLPAITLSNPNNLDVTYSLAEQAEGVAQVANVSADGQITLIADAIGSTTIVAESAENDIYAAGKAQCTITVKAIEKSDSGLGWKRGVDAYTLGSDYSTEQALTVSEGKEEALQDVTYSSSNTDVAEIDATGKITFKADGQTVITAAITGSAYYNDASDSYLLAVSPQETSQVWNLVTSTDQIEPGARYLLCGSTTSGSTTTYYGSGKYNNSDRFVAVSATLDDNDLTFTEANTSSLNPVFINVTDDGNYQFIDVDQKQFINGGTSKTVTFSYTTQNSNKHTIDFDSKTNKVTIKDKKSSKVLCFNTNMFRYYDSSMSPTYLYKEAKGEKPKAEAGLAYDPTTISVDLTTQTLTQPTLKNPNNLTVTYSSSNSEVATVDEAGVITLNNTTGTATITASSEATDAFKAGKAECTITVTRSQVDANVHWSEESVSVNLSDKDSFVAPTLVNEENVEINYYESSAPKVAAVDSETGEVTIKSVGTATITAYWSASEYYNGGSAEYTITVLADKWKVVIGDNEYTETQNDAIEVYGDTPIVLSAPKATSFTIDGVDSGTSTVQAENSYTFYASQSDIYTFSAKTASGYEYDEIMIELTLKAHAAPAVTIDGATLTDDEAYIYEGESTLNATPDGTPSAYILTGTETVEIAADMLPYRITKADDYTLKAVYTFGTEGKSVESEVAKFKLYASSKPLTYGSVTATSQLVEGATYMIASPKFSVAVSNEVNKDNRRSVAVDLGESDQVVAPASEVMLFTVKGNDADGWQWIATGYNGADNLGLTLSDDGTGLTMTEEPTKTIVTIADDGTASIKVAADSDREIGCYSSNDSFTFGNYKSNQLSNANYSPVRIYGVVAADQTSEISSFSDLDAEADEQYYTADVTVTYRYGDELWLKDEKDNILYAVAGDFTLSSDIKYGSKLRAFKLFGADTVTDSYFEAYLNSAPLIVSEIEGYNGGFTTIDPGTGLNESHLGKIVLVKGTVYSAEDNEIWLESTDDNSHEAYYVLKYHFMTDDSNTGEGAPRRVEESNDETGSFLWNTETEGGWDTSVLPTGDLYASGIVAKDGNDYVLYTLKIAEDEGFFTGVPTIGASKGGDFYMVGNDIYLPAGAAIYNLSGAKVSSFNLASGIYIIRFVGGATAKVMVK